MKFKNEIKEPFILIKWFIDSKDRVVGITRDILNYIFIWKNIRKYRNSKTWEELNMRADYIGRIYAVVNLRAEDFGDNDPKIKESRYTERAEQLYLYITELNLHEIVSPDISHVPNTYSYLVIFTPLFRWLTFRWFLWFVIRISFIVVLYNLFWYMIYPSTYFQHVVNFITKLFNK